WLLLLTIFTLATVLVSRLIIEVMTQVILRKIGISSRTAIVGIGENGRRIEDTFNRRSFWGFNVVGYIDHEKRIEKDKKYSSTFNILGHTEDVKKVITENNIQRVIVSELEYKYFEILEIIEQLKGLDVSIMLFPGFFEFSIKRMAVREISGIPLMQVANIGFFGINLFLKNMVDYVFGIIIFILFIPIYLIVGLMIKIDSQGPVFYKQKRYTKKCKEFYIYKFRTMFLDADKRLEELKHLNEADGPLFKIKNDPRITNVGRFLRKFSIDELPQIINVLRGELSLVGPRPPIPEEVEQYNEWEMKRLVVKQGITGLWQISGRSELNFEEMTRLDLYYIQNWSIFMDIMIILKTLPAVIFSKGAY
ncbi:MAG: sugar transferase, partial [Candidatus Humimicrobiaceae bacterium]